MAEPGPDALAVLDTYQRQISALSRQLDFLNAVFEETVRARASLEGLAEEKEKEVLVPLGANTFIRGSATDRKVAITGIGAGYSVEKPWDQAVQQLKQREADVQSEIQRVAQAVVQLQQEAAQLQEDLEEQLGPGASGAES